MIEGKSVLAIIPARGGSKGLPGKNIKLLCGKPLLAWSLEQAFKSKYLDTVFVSTDSEEIANIAKQYGGDIPFLRPPEIAADNSPTSDAIIHALENFERIEKYYDYVVLLEPTSPLRKPADIDTAIQLLVKNEDADTLVSLGEIHMEHPMIVKKIDESGRVVPYVENVKKIHQRQQADKAYFPYGVIYISKVSEFKKNLTFYTQRTIPYFIERWQNFEVDDEIDFAVIETIMAMKTEVINGRSVVAV